MGSFGSSGLASIGGLAFDSANLYQGWHYGSRIEEICRKCMDLDAMGIRLDALSTIREQKRDEVFEIMSSLDNLMVVSTLMLSIGFGFVVDGTFPPKKAERLSDWPLLNVDPLVVYSFLAALSLIFPFWSLVLGVHMRYELEHEVAVHMKEFKHQLFNVLKDNKIKAPKDEEAQIPDAPQTDLMDVDGDEGHSPDATQRSMARRLLDKLRCGRRASEAWRSRVTGPAARIADSVRHTFTPVNIERFELEKAEIRKWAKRDMLQRLKLYRFLKLAKIFLWMGIFCSIFTSAILLGLYMQQNFPDTPNMWMVYSSLVTVNGLIGIFTVVRWIWRNGKDTKEAGNSARVSDDDSFFPALRRAMSVETLVRGGLPRVSLPETRYSGSKSPPQSPRSPRRSSFSGLSSLSGLSDMWPAVHVRIRERRDGHADECTGAGLANWFEVRLPGYSSSDTLGSSRIRFDAFAKTVSAKFQRAAHLAHAADGTEPRGNLRLGSLVLLRENLVICDDGDMDLLKDDDELEVVFAER